MHTASKLVLEQRKSDLQEEGGGARSGEGAKDLMSFLREYFLVRHSVSLTDFGRPLSEREEEV